MKKSLILLLTLIMMISLVIISCNPDSSSGQAAVKEETFTVDTYNSIQKDNENAISTLGELVSKFNMDNPPSKVTATVTMGSDEDSSEGFSLLTQADITESGTLNVYEYITADITCEFGETNSTVSNNVATESGDTQRGGDNTESELTFSATIKYKLTTSSSNEVEISNISSFIGENSSSDALISDFQVLMTKSLAKDDGDNREEAGYTLDDYLAIVLGVGNAAPAMSVSVTVGDGENAVTFGIENVTIKGSGRTLNLGGKISFTAKGEGDKETNIVSLGGNVSLTLSDDFKISLDDAGNLEEPVGSVNFAVSDIELICGDNAIVVNGKIQDGHISAKYGYAKFYFSEKVGEEVLIVTEFTFNTRLSDGVDSLDWFEFNKFVYKGVSYSGESVKAVLKKVLESSQTE